MNICIIKYGALGDVVRTSFFAEPLSKERNARIYWFTSVDAIPLLIVNPYVDRVSANIEDFLAVEFDEVYNLEDEVYFAEIVKRLRFKKIVGSSLEDGNLTYSKDSASWFDMGIISVYGKERADRLKRENTLSHSELFSEIFRVSKPTPKIYYKASEYSHVDVLINPYAGNRWKSKELIHEELVKLIENLISISSQRFKIQIGLLGAGGDFERNLGIKKKFSNQNIDLKVYYTDDKLEDLIYTIDRYCDILITTDSLALHIANGLNKKVICFFSPTSANEIDLFHGGEKIISTSSDYCSYKRDCDNSSITAQRLSDAFLSLVLK